MSSSSIPESIAAELHAILQHERADEILANDWLHDGSLPIPSVEAICLFGSILLNPELEIKPGDPLPEKTMNFFEFAGTHTFDQVLTAILFHLRKLGVEELAQFARREWGYLESERLRHDGDRAHEWRQIDTRFRYMAFSESAAINNGARGIARRLLESLFLRAVFFRDTEAISSLAELVAGKNPEPGISQSIASKIVLVRNPLAAALGRKISKGDMKAFLGEVFPHFANARDEAWSKAWRLADWPSGEDRKGRRDHADAIAVAKAYKRQLGGGD